MSDMIKATEPKSDQWNFDDFRAGPMTFTIESVRVKSGQDQPVEISLAGTPKFFRPCKSMSRCLVAAWGADSKQYAGRSLTLYGDPKVKWGGLEVGGIRISHMTDIPSPMTLVLTESKANRKPFTVRPLAVPQDSGRKAEQTGVGISAAPASTAPPSDDDPPIDEKQLSTITDLLNEHGVPEAEFLAFAELEAIKDFPARLFTRACAWIKKQGKT